jgi:hypothetical protein
VQLTTSVPKPVTVQEDLEERKKEKKTIRSYVLSIKTSESIKLYSTETRPGSADDGFIQCLTNGRPRALKFVYIPRNQPSETNKTIMRTSATSRLH